MKASSTLCLMAFALVLVPIVELTAAPHDGDVFSLRQPDGTRVEVRVFGDEFYQRVESIDGFSLVRDGETGWICYARLADDGEDFVSTGVIYRGGTVDDLPEPRQRQRIKRLRKRLRLKTSAIRRKAQARRTELFAGEEGASGPELDAQPAPAPAEPQSVLGLTILIQFPDEPGTISRAEIDRFCNQVGYSGYGNNGSVRDYFWDVSNHNLEYTNYVTEYYTARNEKSYYDDCDSGKTRELLGEALNWLDDQGFDFSMLTLDGNNRIVALNVFYAGSPDCGWAKGLWPHKGSYSGFTSDSGIRSRDYQITNIGSQLRLGTFCHENGHMVCKWPDLYDYGGESRGVGGYCLMASSGGRNPRPPNAHFRDLRGWETIIDITNDPPGTLRTHQANSFTTFRYSHPTNEREFFLVESRLKTGRNAGLPDEGLLIWHIDRDGSNNNEQMTPEKHYRVSVEQADGQFHLERDINGGGSNDLFHAGNNDTFDDYTVPDARWWDQSESGLRITGISDVGPQMTFIVDNSPIKLRVAPGAEQQINGLPGGPFAPEAITYSLTNSAATTIDWQLTKTADWLIAPASGTVAPGDTTLIEIALGPAAESLPLGSYTDTVVFTDLTYGSSLERQVELVVAPRELIAHWKFDEASGTEVTDATGHGNTGTIEGGASFDTSSADGRFGQALELDGIDDTVFFEGFALPRPFYTISFWFKPDTDLSRSSSRLDLLYWNNGNHPHITFDKKNTGEIGLYVEYDSVEYEDIITTTRSWPASAWHHLAFTFDGTDYGVYVNGNLEQTYNHPGMHVDTLDPYLGSRKSNDNFFDGRIDDWRFYNYALESDAVFALYRGGRAENPAPADGQTNVRPYTALRWLPRADTGAHDVYLGSDYLAVLNATFRSAEYKDRLEEPYYTGAVLAENTRYFWRIDEVVSPRSIMRGRVWSFTTGTNSTYEQLYEAEDALLSGPEVASNHPGFTGSGFADYMNQSSDYIEWTVFAHYSGEHEITFRYALGSGDRPLEIRVNDQLVHAGLSFPATGDYAVWTYTETLEVTLRPGYNTIRATAIGSKGANIDHLKLIEHFAYLPEPTGLQAYFRLDESAGTIAHDSSGKLRNATLFGDPLWQPGAGALGGALQFDGAGDYVRALGYKGPRGAMPRTVAAWVKTTSQAPAQVLSWGADAPGQKWSLAIEPALGAFGVDVGAGSVFGTNSVTDGKWHHLAAVLPGPDVAQTRLYLDGSTEPLRTIESRPVNTAQGYDVKIANFDDTPNQYFEGFIDDVVIFDLALSDHQIARLAQLGGRAFIAPCGRALLGPAYDLQGDIDKSCAVDALDFAFLAENWLATSSPLLGDIQHDDSVDWQDLALLAANWTTAIAPPTLEQGLVAHWRLDESSGSLAADSVSDHHATLHGQPTWRPAAGWIAGAIQLDGIDDYLATPFLLNPAEQTFSAVAWIKGGAPGQVVIAQTDVNRTAKTWLAAEPVTGALMTGLREPGRGRKPLVSDYPITDGNWHCIAVVWDGLYRSLYADGALVIADSAELSGLTTGTGGLYFGADNSLSAGSFLAGLIDEIRVYDRPLDPVEVSALAY